MAMKLQFPILSLCFLLFLYPVRSSVGSGDLNWWCNQTPYPEPCTYHMRQSPQNLSSISRTEARKMTAHIALNQALDELNYTKWLGQNCVNEREKAAWTNCLMFYNLTILQLNRTLDFNEKYTPFDVQTWLSAALTNLQTCRTGFVELNITNNIFPLMSNNVTKLISNVLAINSASIEDQTSYQGGFPSWFSREEQRLLLSDSDHVDFVVAQDGYGNFSTIKEALDASLNRTYGRRFVIYLKKGIYKENIVISANMKNLMLVGDGVSNTIITGDRSSKGGYLTFDTPTFKIFGDGFIARDITFRNTAGPDTGQAVALASASDCSVFNRCNFEGYQDTLLTHAQRQFYQQCNIFGTVDFIFGNAAVVLQNCSIFARRPIPGGVVVITAQDRTDPNQNTGMSIHNCRVTAALDLQSVVAHVKVYLGRPWGAFSQTVYLHTFMDSLVNPAGWLEWNRDPSNLGTLYYGEYKNYGPGSDTRGRVKWAGYKVITDVGEAEKFSVEKLIVGQLWLPETGVPFISGV